jgi:ATP-dependent RNA helicase RhlB
VAGKPAAMQKPVVRAPVEAKPVPKWTIDQYVVPPVEGKTRFHDLNLAEPILHAIADLEFQYCTTVQARAIPPSLEGKDVTGRAQTGTGKTAAFLVAVFTHFLRKPRVSPGKMGAPRALILAPTRELVIQIEHDARLLGKYCGCKVLGIYGGMDYEKQQTQLKTISPDVIVATPGRLLDFRRGGILDLRSVEILVIDEADRMLDMGFIPDVRTIVHSMPNREVRQTLLFSATLTEDIMRLASRWMNEPVTVEVEPEKVTVDSIKQVVYTVSSKDRFSLFYNLLQRDNPDRVLMFCNRRDETEHVMQMMERCGISAAMLSGAVPQTKRLKVLEGFREGKIRVLVATDVAGRGLHVDGISHVINYDIPFDAEDYVHRIGRTGRAGATGVAYTFACENEAFSMPEIEKYIGRTLDYENPEPALLVRPPALGQYVHQRRPMPSRYAGSGPRRFGGAGRSSRR